MATVAKEIEDLKNRTLHLERILILGDGDRLPLAEVVRNLTNTVNDYITQKQKEEEAVKKQKVESEKERKAQWDKLKWVIISFAAPAILIFLGQAFILLFRVYPILEDLATKH